MLGAAIAPVNMTDAPLLPAIRTQIARALVGKQYFDRVYSQTPNVAVDMHLYPYGGDRKLKKLAVEVRYGLRYCRVDVTEVAVLGEMGPRKRAKLTGRVSTKLDSLQVAAAMFFRLAAVRPDMLGWRSEAISVARCPHAHLQGAAQNVAITEGEGARSCGHYRNRRLVAPRPAWGRESIDRRGSRPSGRSDRKRPGVCAPRLRAPDSPERRWTNRIEVRDGATAGQKARAPQGRE